jgi:hypothetical protein
MPADILRQQRLRRVERVLIGIIVAYPFVLFVGFGCMYLLSERERSRLRNAPAAEEARRVVVELEVYIRISQLQAPVYLDIEPDGTPIILICGIADQSQQAAIRALIAEFRDRIGAEHCLKVHVYSTVPQYPVRSSNTPYVEFTW